MQYLLVFKKSVILIINLQHVTVGVELVSHLLSIMDKGQLSLEDLKG
jgi:hypothetical protein